MQVQNTNVPKNDPKEFMRRVDTGKQIENTSPLYLDINQTRREFKPSLYQFIIINIAHIKQKPRKEKPAVRFLGGFESHAEACSFIQQHTSQFTGCNMWIIPMRQWFCMCENQERQQDPKYSIKKIADLKHIYAEHKNMRNREFKTNMNDKKSGKTEQSIFNQVQAAKRKELKAKRDARQANTVSTRKLAKLSLPRPNTKKNNMINDIENSNEKQVSFPPEPTLESLHTGVDIVNANLIDPRKLYVVTSWMHDITKQRKTQECEPEPCGIVWDFFDSVDAAREFIKNQASKYIIDFAMEIVDCYAWLFPEEDRTEIQEMYRNEEQQRIMDQHRQEKQTIANYEETLRAQGKTLEIVDVYPNIDPKTNQVIPSEIKPMPRPGELVGVTDHQSNEIDAKILIDQNLKKIE